MTLSAGKARGLQRISDGEGRFGVLAVDQRPPLMQIASKATGKALNQVDSEIGELKGLLAEHLSRHATGILVDPFYGYHTVMPHVGKNTGLLLTLEHHAFEQTPAGHRKSGIIPGWSVEQALKAGAEAIKVLAWYRPDAPEDIQDHQKEFVYQCGQMCKAYDRAYIFEVLPYPLLGEDPHTYDQGLAEMSLEIARAFADPAFAVDLYKLAIPCAPKLVQEWGGSAYSLAQVGQWMQQTTEFLPAPWVLLSGGMDTAKFIQGFAEGVKAGVSGYMAGRAVWWDALQAYPDVAACKHNLDTQGVAALQALNTILATIPSHTPAAQYHLSPKSSASRDNLTQGDY